MSLILERLLIALKSNRSFPNYAALCKVGLKSFKKTAMPQPIILRRLEKNSSDCSRSPLV